MPASTAHRTRQGDLTHLLAATRAVTLNRMRATSKTSSSFRVREDGASCSSAALGSEPEQDRCEGKHREEVLGPLLVARSHSAVLLEATDQPFHSVALPLQRVVESTHMPPVGGPLIRAAWDHSPDALAREHLPYARVAIALVAHDAFGSVSWPAGARALHTTQLQ